MTDFAQFSAWGPNPNPDYAAMLRQIWLEQNRPKFDASAGDAEASAAKARYMAETVNPQLGSIAVKDGPNPSSFGAARQADLIAAGNRGSEELFQTAKNGAYDRALKLYQLQLQQFNHDQDAGTVGQMGGSSTGRRVASDDNTDSSYGGRIAGGVLELGKRYLDAKQQGTFNPQATGQAFGNGLKDLIGAPVKFGTGALNALGLRF